MSAASIQSPSVVSASASASASASTPTTTPSLSTLNYLNIAAYLLNVVITYGIGVGGFFDLPTNGDLSKKYQTLVTPVGWAFAIWGIIFGFQALWALLPLFFSKQRQNPFLVAVGFNYVYLCLEQAAWTIAFSTEVIWLSLVFMLMILFFLVKIVLALNNANSAYKGSLASYVLWRLPFTVHAGWIIAASFVNANVLLVSLNVAPNLQFVAALISLFSLFFIASVSTISFDLVVPLVIAWALLGVFYELENPEEIIVEDFNETNVEMAQLGSLSFAVLITLGAVVGIIYQCCRGSRSDSASSDESVYLRA